MQIHHLALRVKDMDKSIAFYTKIAGFQVLERTPAAPGEIAYLQDPEGGSMIEFICMPGPGTFEGSGLFLCFGTSDLESVHAIAVAEGAYPSDIRQPEPNARYFYVYDPDGLSVQFREYK